MPRQSISGELPIDTYFSSAGTIRKKENGSLKRRTGADADDANRTRTKKQRTKQPSKGTNLEAQEKSRSGMSRNIFGRRIAEWQRLGSADARPKAVTGVFATTDIPTPISVAKLPRSASSQMPADMVRQCFRVVYLHLNEALGCYYHHLIVAPSGDCSQPGKRVAHGKERCQRVQPTNAADCIS